MSGKKERPAPANQVTGDVFRRVGEEYRAGFLLVEIAERYGVDEDTVTRWASRYGWTRDLNKRVQARTSAKLAGVEGQDPSPGELEKAVDSAAETQVAVVRAHRKRAQDLYAVFDRVNAYLAAYLDPGVSDRVLKERFPRPILTSTESVGHALHTLASVHSKLVTLERQAYNIDAGVQEKSYEERLKELLGGEAGEG